MFPKIDPTTTAAWQELKKHRERIGQKRISQLFEEDPGRFSRYSITDGDLLADFSKNLIDEEVRNSLQRLAEQCLLAEARDAFFGGELINATENRAVLHHALRNLG